jgi:gamma-glutamylputrescine oxidase
VSTGADRRTTGVAATAPVWSVPGWDAPPPLRGDVRVDTCVVGLGVAGLTAARTLAEHGDRVVAIDAVGVAAGASGRNGGFLLAGLADFHHDAVAELGRTTATGLYRATLAELDRAEGLAPDAVRRTGSLRLASDPEEQDDCAAQLAAMRRDGLPVEAYDGPEGVGLRFPQDAAAQPTLRTRALARHALGAGVQLHERTPAVAVAGDHVETPHGRIACDRTLVCVDGTLEQLLPEVAERGVRTARAQMLGTAPAARPVATQPAYGRWGYDYWQQLPDGRVALGGCRDHGGDAEWTSEAVPTAAVQAHLERFLRNGLGVSAPVTHRWAGLIAFGRGPLPLLAEIRPGVIAVGVYRGTGNLLGALYGRAAAHLAATGRSGLEQWLDPPGPARAGT